MIFFQRICPKIIAVACLAISISSCASQPAGNEATRQAGGGERQQLTAVDAEVAAVAPLSASREYTGTTQPLREVAVRAQAEGQLRQLSVDVGDRVKPGQVLAQIDDSLLAAATAEARAELASRRAEIARLQAQVSDAKTQVERDRLQFQQAQSDAARYRQLAKAGAVSAQQAEQYQTQAQTAAQVLKSAQEKVRVEQQAIAVAQTRIATQQAVLDQQQQRKSFANVTSPLLGAVVARTTDRGNLVRVGDELLRLGDFSQAKAIVQVSELDLTDVKLGSTANVRLDAFPNQKFTGRVARISPAANPTSRLVPVEMTIPNPGGRIGSGLLARVTFAPTEQPRVMVPLSALQADRPQGGNRSGNRASGSLSLTAQAAPARSTGTVFVLAQDGDRYKVNARSVTLGQQSDGRVQVLSGLNPGERYVARAGRPLKSGEVVRLSILSK